MTAYDRALAWGYVNEKEPDQLPSVAQLKKALIEHGPLAMPIHGDSCFIVYQGGIFNGHNMGFPNHVMVLIGWDDAKQAWLVKNSWGEAWGEKGYAWVAYGSNSIGYGSTMIWRDYRAAVRAAHMNGRPANVRDAGHVAAGLLSEFGPATILDTFVLRPLAMGIGMHALGPQRGLVAGKLAADLVFYLPVILMYERRKRRMRNRIVP